ncbi:MAG: guanylate kinase [Christensenellales bacterium]|jgi:guanylate kinase
MNKGRLFVLSGPSGVGKGTILNKVLSSDGNLELSVSATTRAIRNGEVDGVNYHFIPLDKFKQMISDGELLEYAVVYDNYYGTLKNKTLEQLNSGKDVILEIDPVGAMNIKSLYPDAVTIFLIPPDRETLEKRLRNRGTETEEVFNKRVAAATEEINMSKYYDYKVINDDADKCSEEVIKIIKDEKSKRRINYVN